MSKLNKVYRLDIFVKIAAYLTSTCFVSETQIKKVLLCLLENLKLPPEDLLDTSTKIHSSKAVTPINISIHIHTYHFLYYSLYFTEILLKIYGIE